MRPDIPQRRLGDLFVFKNGRAFKKDEWSAQGLPIIRIQNLNSEDAPFNYFDGEYSQDILVEQGNLLFSWSGTVGSSFGSHLWDGETGLLNQHIFKIGLRDGITKQYAFYGLRHITEEIERSVNGAVGLVHITKEKLNEFRLPVPQLAEQRRIVAILDEAFDGIATAKADAEKNLRNARALFESLLNVAIQGKLIPQTSGDASILELIKQIEKARNVAIDRGRARPEKTEPVEPKDGSQLRLPGSWKWAQLESLTVGISDGVHKTPQYVSKGIPFITVKNLTAGPGISFDDLNYITQEDHKEFIKRTRPEKGDILITKDGTIGVVRLIETDIEFSVFVSVALIKPVIRELGPYLVYALRASCVQSQIVPQGAALKHLYLVDLRRLAIPLPPMSEQKRMVAMLDSLNDETQRLASLYEQKIDALEALKKSLLHHAFTGRL
jgi:type I restriction enzyme S subunit